ncbi:MAG: hypothetical protein WC971_08455 [Coriobacteriia bacterium]
MTRTKGVALAVAAAALVLALPALADGVPVTYNAYGRAFVGRGCSDQSGGTGLGCHSTGRDGASIVNSDTPHHKMVQDVRAHPSALLPAASASGMWPTPTFGTGLRVFPSNIAYIIGGSNLGKEYVLIPGSAITAGYGPTSVPFPSGAPADDLPLLNGCNGAYENGAWTWAAEGVVGVSAYFQRCGGCHNLGVTRAANATYTLGDGVATMGRSTPTTVAALSILCEVCHGTGREGGRCGVEVAAWTTAGPRPILSSRVCGQCHVTGTARETNYAGSGKFSNPNGYTVDQTLTAYFDVASTVPSEGGFVAGTGSSASKFYPNGANQTMRHSYYNEWLKTGHAKTLTSPGNNVLNAARGRVKCLRCHTGEGFLDYIGASIVPTQFDVTLTTLPVSGRWTTNAMYAQECVICHVSHDSRSGLGRRTNQRTGRRVSCGDCHNWQYEVLETTITSNYDLPISSYRSGSVRVSHPNREMLAGRGLPEVTLGEEFMPGARCSGCHMPDTARNAQRPSHRFLPMEPGDAERWQVKEEGDSCTPCHPSLSRESLQESIEEWKDTFAAGDRTASAAIDAGYLRGFATSSATNWMLYKKAYLIRSYLRNDGSSGVHNPPYAAAGWAKAAYMAKAIGGSVSIADAGGGTYIWGTVSFGDGTAVREQVVSVEAKPYGATGWATLSSTKTDSAGRYSVNIAPTVNTRYRVVWRVTSTERISSSDRLVSVRARTSLVATPFIVPFGRAFTLTGRVTPAQAGSVVIQYRPSTSSVWRTLTRRTLSGTGTFAYRLTRARGAWWFRATWAGNARYAGSTSAPVIVFVH